MKNSSKRFWIGLLAVVLMAAALPVQVFAEDPGTWVIDIRGNGKIGDEVVIPPDPGPDPGTDPDGNNGGTSGGTNNNSGGGSGRRDNLDNNRVVLDDDGVPLGFYVEDEDGNLIYIGTEEIPLGTLPETGTQGNLAVAMAVMAIAAGAIMLAGRKA